MCDSECFVLLVYICTQLREEELCTAVRVSWRCMLVSAILPANVHQPWGQPTEDSRLCALVQCRHRHRHCTNVSIVFLACSVHILVTRCGQISQTFAIDFTREEDVGSINATQADITQEEISNTLSGTTVLLTANDPTRVFTCRTVMPI